MTVPVFRNFERYLVVVALDEILVGEQHERLHLDVFGGLQEVDELVGLLFGDVEGELIDVGALEVFLLCCLAHNRFIHIFLSKNYLIRCHLQLRLRLAVLGNLRYLLEVQL